MNAKEKYFEVQKCSLNLNSVLAFLTLIVAIGGIWTASETHKLVKDNRALIDYEITPKINFFIDIPINGKTYDYLNNITRAPYDEFLKNPVLRISIINYWNRPIDIGSVFVFGDCIKGTYFHNDTDFRAFTLIGDNHLIKAGEQFYNETTTLSQYLNRQMGSCQMFLFVDTDVGTRLKQRIEFTG